MSGQIFLYISNGRTLWVPRHTASPTETKPVCMLNYVTPMELSRSFYLFDYAVQVVENAQMAAMNPNAKTPNEVLAAVNDFRRVCAEDQNFLLQRCYNSPAQQQQQQQQQPQQQQPQQQQPQQVNAYPTPYSSSPSQQQQLMMSSATTSGYGGGSNNAGAAGGMDSAALLTQLLQQQRQQSRMISGGNTSNQGYQDNGAGGAYGYNNDGRNYYGGDRGRGDRRMHGNAYGNSMGYSQNMMMMQGGMPRPQQPMMMGYNSMNPYGMDQMMMYGGGPGQMYPNARGGSGRRSNNYGDPMMMMAQQPGMYGSRRGMGSHSQSQQQSRMGATVRNEPEPINLDGVTVPEEIKTVYMNPAQQLVIATMPGPHMTVWLREHPFPTDLQDKKFVFGKKGICLMLKASFEEVKGSKPVELFPKQICTHFFIYGYCSRPNCFHEHHNEDQLRELIAARHVQLKAMTKAQRHQLIDEIEKKEKEGLAAAAAHREEREKKRAEAAAEREARRQQRQQQLSQQGQMYTSSSAPNTQPNPSQDIGSDNEDDDAMTQGGAGSSQQQPSANPSVVDMMASSPSQDHQAVSAGAGEATAEASKTPSKSDVAAKLGITDSDDGDDNDGSSSSASGSSSTSNTKAKADVVEASAADEDEGDAEEEHDDAEDEEQQEEEEEEDAKAKKSKAKKPAPKKRGRAAAPKKATKRTKKQ
ncbi:protein of unknown function - conserved [Leishmania donovani]|uniref:Hypothetical_protein_conserved n=1 Tax=Leishmania donovani TaxID=5661 RepID=A0A6J8FAF4_LEIDO|nr:protein of unknown function - conserved [Leishmania donovani]VDZ43068.1 hypothetical_protein_conserved [Leishmania donovani]